MINRSTPNKVWMDLIIENNNNMDEMYRILFEGLDVDNNRN